MHRVGPNSSFYSNLNSLMATSVQTTGLFTNIAPLDPSTGTFRLGFDRVVPPFPTSFTESTLFVCRSVLPPAFLVSAAYLRVMKTTTGYDMRRDSGYSGNFRQDLPLDVPFSSGHGFRDNDVSYIRINDVMPSVATLEWLSTAVGTEPTQIICYDRDTIVLDNTIATPRLQSKTGKKFDIVVFKYDATDITFRAYLQSSSFVIGTLPVSLWALGNVLPGRDFEIIVALGQF